MLPTFLPEGSGKSITCFVNIYRMEIISVLLVLAVPAYRGGSCYFTTCFRVTSSKHALHEDRGKQYEFIVVVIIAIILLL